MSDLVASVLSALVASYEKPADPIDPSFLPTPEESVIGRNIDRATAKKLVAGETSTAAPSPTAARPENGFQAAPISKLPGPKSEPMPEAGSLEAAGFLKAMRNAGLRKGKLDPSVKREDEIRAIAAYCGYNSNELHGSQEVAARMRAQRELHPIKVDPNQEWRRNGSPKVTVAGYVAGVADHVAKQVENLKAQEVVAAEQLCEHRNVLLNPHASMDDRAKATLLVKLEEERLAAIRADLSALGEKV